MAATAITGDFGIITVVKKPATSVGDSITGDSNVKRTGQWLEVAAKAATGSKFGDLAVGDLFYLFTGDSFVPTTGDKYYKLEEHWLSWATNWTINITPSIIDTTGLGTRFPRTTEGRATVDSNISGFLFEGDQLDVTGVDADELPVVDFREIKQQYLEVTRFERDADKKTTKIPKKAVTGNERTGIFGTSKAGVSILFYSVAADVDLGVVSAYFAPQASWAGLQVGSGDAGSRSDFTMPITFQYDRLNRTVKSYEYVYDNS